MGFFWFVLTLEKSRRFKPISIPQISPDSHTTKICGGDVETCVPVINQLKHIGITLWEQLNKNNSTMSGFRVIPSFRRQSKYLTQLTSRLKFLD
jgi:hypothetical protein